MKKGFTIVEIILSITLILVIGIGGILIYRNNAKEKTLENMKEEIYRAVNVLVETDSVTKKQLYQSKNGAIIPLKKLESEGLIDFNGLHIEDEYVLSMLGNEEESERCSGTLYNIGSWSKSEDDVIYICGGSNIGGDNSPKLLKDIVVERAKNMKSDSIYFEADKITDEEKSLYDAFLLSREDDYGTSYYFNGFAGDNYVNFAGMCWQIIRIQGDGSIKIGLYSKTNTCDGVASDVFDSYKNVGTVGENGAYYGYTYDYITDSNGNKSSNKVYVANYLSGTHNYEYSMSYGYLNWQEDALKKMVNYYYDVDLADKLKSGDWCLDEKPYKKVDSTYVPISEEEKKQILVSGEQVIYGPSVRNSTNSLSLKCNGEIMKKFDDNRNGNIESTETDMYVAGLTLDEYVFLGGAKSFLGYYTLNMGYSSFASSISAATSSSVYTFSVRLDTRYITSGAFYLKPNIILKSDTYVTGIGTRSNPYIVQ